MVRVLGYTIHVKRSRGNYKYARVLLVKPHIKNPFNDVKEATIYQVLVFVDYNH